MITEGLTIVVTGATSRRFHFIFRSSYDSCIKLDKSCNELTPKNQLDTTKVIDESKVNREFLSYFCYCFSASIESSRAEGAVFNYACRKTVTEARTNFQLFSS